ncbi:MAG: hypothetical protein RIG84_10480 [Roseovarius sp.]
MPNTHERPTKEAIAALPGIKGVSETVFFRADSVPRSPCEAQKDPRIPRRLTPATSKNWENDLKVLSAPVASDLLAIARVICPHDWLAVSVYQSVILAMDRDAGFARGILAEYEALPPVFPRTPSSLSEEELIQSLRQIETTRFFRSFLGMTIHLLYDDPEVWSGCGYEGVAGCKQGQPREDIADADWLPDPQSDGGNEA